LYVSGTATIGSGTGVLQSTGGIVSSIANGSNGQVLKISGGVPAWGADLTGSGGGSSAWATTTDSLAVYPATPSNVILVGTNATSTTGNILEVKGNTLLRGSQTTQGAITASSFTATSSNATSTFSGGLSVLNFAQTGSATSAGTSGWNIAVGCYAINNQCLSFSTLAGQISLSSQITGVLTVSNGGTGSTTLSGVLKGNGTSQLATAIGGTDYEFPLTFNSPLSRTGNAISISTSGDWSGTLGGFTAAQLIAAGFSTTSALNFLSLNTGDAFSTSSASYFLTQNRGNAYATTSADYWLTQKTTDNLAQGSTNKYYATSLFAADLAATTTDALSQGSTNKYWSNTLFDNRLSATTSLPNIITLANLSFSATQLTNFGNPFYIFFHGTTTDALTEGTNNKYFTNARADARISATSTIGTLTSAPSLGTLATSLTGFLKATAGALSTALIDLTSNVTGILPVGNGGTGWASLAAGAIPYGNGASAVATTSAGTAGQVLALLNGVPTWVATSIGNHAWMDSMLPSGSKVLFAYDSPQGLKYVRYSLTPPTGIDESAALLHGETIQLSGNGAFFSVDPQTGYLYATGGSTAGGLGVLISRDNGTTWHDFAQTHDFTGGVYAAGGARNVSDDGDVIGSFTDTLNGNAVYFFKVKADRPQ
jgi:hypothetical protein